MNRKVGLLVVAGIVLLAVIIGLGVAIFGMLFHMMDTSDAHVCGLAIAQRSPVAAQLVGTPVVQDGITSGHEDLVNGDTSQRMTFNVRGPKGQASVIAAGTRSKLQSTLTVQIGRDGNNTTIYSGDFDCPELHTAKK